MQKILIAEDDQFLAKMYAKKFEIAGFEIQVAHDGEDALVKMKTFKPNLVLMDVMMPKMNGLEALEKAKADPELKSIPIVIFTNLSSVEDEGAAKKKGADGYIVKSNSTPTEIVTEAKKYLK